MLTRVFSFLAILTATSASADSLTFHGTITINDPKSLANLVSQNNQATSQEFNEKTLVSELKSETQADLNTLKSVKIDLYDIIVDQGIRWEGCDYIISAAFADGSKVDYVNLTEQDTDCSKVKESKVLVLKNVKFTFKK